MSAVARRALRGAGLRVTPSRLAVYDALALTLSPVSHGEVWSQMDPRHLDRATVYRNLLAMVDVGLVKRMDLGDHVWRFELASTEAPARGGHPHFVCTECGQVECLDDVEVAVRGKKAGPRAVVDQAVEVHLRGRCDDCG